MFDEIEIEGEIHWRWLWLSSLFTCILLVYFDYSILVISLGSAAVGTIVNEVLEYKRKSKLTKA